MVSLNRCYHQTPWQELHNKVYIQDFRMNLCLWKVAPLIYKVTNTNVKFHLSLTIPNWYLSADSCSGRPCGHCFGLRKILIQGELILVDLISKTWVKRGEIRKSK